MEEKDIQLKLKDLRIAHLETVINKWQMLYEFEKESSSFWYEEYKKMLNLLDK